MSEIRLAASPAAGRPANPRRRIPVIGIAAAGAAALAAALVLALLPANTPVPHQPPPGCSPRSPPPPPGSRAPQVRDSQFWFIKSWGAGMGCNAATGGKCVLDKPHERQIWQSVSNLCVTGLLREHGQNIPLTFASDRQHCPDRGGVHDPTYRFLQSLPTDPHALLSLIDPPEAPRRPLRAPHEGPWPPRPPPRRQMPGQLSRPEEAFITIGDLLREAIAPPGSAPRSTGPPP